MERYTKATDWGNYVVENTMAVHTENGCTGDAIDRLAAFENVYEALTKEQDDIAHKMDKLRSEGKSKTVTFKQLMANKLTNINLLSILGTYVE